MIPPPIIRFIEERANVGFAGTRDAHLVPCGHRVSAWRVGAGGRTLTACLPESSAAAALEALLENGRVAITLEEAGTHETYQLKGRYLSHRPAQPADVDLASRLRERFVKGLRILHGQPGPAERLGASVPPPALAVEVEVDEVFLQTPGPGAGSRLAPAPDEGGREAR
jgi:hypothetical protein